MQTATLVNGFVLGWSVAWPPGPVNAEMLRRSVIPRAQAAVAGLHGSLAWERAREIFFGRSRS